jgi:hypothetical protein
VHLLVQAMDVQPCQTDTSTGWTFHRLADVFPMMDEAALAELAADIKAGRASSQYATNASIEEATDRAIIESNLRFSFFNTC